MKFVDNLKIRDQDSIRHCVVKLRHRHGDRARGVCTVQGRRKLFGHRQGGFSGDAESARGSTAT